MPRCYQSNDKITEMRRRICEQSRAEKELGECGNSFLFLYVYFLAALFLRAEARMRGFIRNGQGGSGERKRERKTWTREQNRERGVKMEIVVFSNIQWNACMQL